MLLAPSIAQQVGSSSYLMGLAAFSDFERTFRAEFFPIQRERVNTALDRKKDLIKNLAQHLDCVCLLLCQAEKPR